MNYAVGGACRVLHHALLEAVKNASDDAAEEPRTIRVIFIGHSLGGAVAARAADVVAAHFGARGEQSKMMEGLERTVVAVAGLCTLNGAITLEGEKKPFESLHESRALVICGDADEVVPPESSAQLFEALPMKEKRHLVLPGGSHDLFSFKEQLIEELTHFVLEVVGLVTTHVEAAKASGPSCAQPEQAPSTV
jgi:pimeloyl-ACP methyl ester carboxylesterase